jgi:hypothetical protein
MMRSRQIRSAALAAIEGELDGLTAQRFGFAIEQPLGNQRRLVARTGPAPRRIARSALLEGAPRPPCWLFLQEIGSHAHLLCGKGGPLRDRHWPPPSDKNLSILAS